MRTSQKIIGLSLAALMSLTALGFHSNAEEKYTARRISGADRYVTAIGVSEKFSKSDYVIVASGEGFADALIGGTLTSQLKTPMLLVKKDKIPAGVKDSIRRLSPKKIYLLGGTETISEDVEDQLKDIATVKRLAGENRLKTAMAIAEERTELSGSKISGDQYAEVDGNEFPDALVASPLVGMYGGKDNLMMLFPVGRNSVKNGFTGVAKWFFGGKYREYPGLTDRNTVIFEGKDRYETAVKVAEAYRSRLNIKPDTVILVRGDQYPDALTASSLSAKYKAPILLTNGKRALEPVKKYLRENHIKKIVAVGGHDSISDSVLNTYLDTCALASGGYIVRQGR